MATAAPTTEPSSPPAPSRSKRDGIAGAAAAALSLAAGELVAGASPTVPSLVESVGGLVIDSVPPPVKDLAISLFGIHDKLVLIVGIALVTMGLGWLVGRLARRRFAVAAVVFGGFGAVGAFATAREPGVSAPAALLSGTVAALAGMVALRLLLRGRPSDAEGRREFLLRVGAVAGLAAISAAGGRWLIERARRAVSGREEVNLPVLVEAVPPPSPAASLDIEGLTPIIVPNRDFYRIDTALSVPRVDLSTWTLRVTGMVDRPYQISFPDLLDLDMVERYITLSCVSNVVGGDLVGNAKWLGAPLQEVLERAGVRADAEQLVGRSVDGFTVGFPVEAAFDGRNALVAVGMNDEPLPFEHGFPARLVVAGLYGYVSATKWLSEIELTTWDGFDAYWVPRGWAKEAPIKTQARIDTPRPGARVAPGGRMIAGVAWAPHRGISRVEVQVDEMPWIEAELSEPLSNDAWRQWAVSWDATLGLHALRVRATDGTGETQTEDEVPPAPDGATGWHTVMVSVEASVQS